MYRLTVEPIGVELDVEEDQTILDACLRAGVYLPHACVHGLCGTCKVEVLEGDVDHGDASLFALMDFEREEGKTLACSATLCSDIEIEAEIDEDPDAEHHPVEDFTATVTRIEDLTSDIKGIWLELPGNGITFQAGQYINLNVPGVEGARAFSLANSPTEPNLIELHVRLVEGGKATTWLHEQLSVGDRLEFTGPYGQFFVRKSAPDPIIFLAGGSGLSSPKSMILDLLEQGWEKPISLVYGAREQEGLYYRDLFQELARKYENFSYIPALSASNGDDGWEGEAGFVHEAAERCFDNHFEGHKAYLCGPPPMIDACVTSLMHGRLFEKHIYMEKFLTEADDAQSKTRSPLFRKI
ncbi:MAG: phenol 2-monooxygenase domain-containing protein [Sneathiella sp.]